VATSVCDQASGKQLVELLMSELFLKMSSACLRVLAVVSGERQLKASDQDAIFSTYAQITGAFGQLAQERFVERLPALVPEHEVDEMDGSGAH
jgi:hypothetical protein